MNSAFYLISYFAAGDSLRRSYKICQALCKKSGKPLDKRKKIAPLHFRVTS